MVAFNWKPLRYHPLHAKIWYNAHHGIKRFKALVAGRSSGKTELARRWITTNLGMKKDHPDKPIFIYCCPTYPQAEKIAWYPILELIPPEWIPKDGANKSKMRITTIFGSTLYIVGMDKPHRIEGLHVDGVIIDESSDQRPDIFQKTIMPMLTARNGWCWRIGVPKKSGVGRADFKDFFLKGVKGHDPSIDSFMWKSSEVLTAEQMDEVLSKTDEQTFNEQYNAEWLDGGGQIYYNYSSDNDMDCKYDPDRDIHVGCDFNVNPMCWTLAHWIDNKLYVFDELMLRNTNTPAALTALIDRYNDHRSRWFFYGDASARSRKTNSSTTDYYLIKNDSRFGDKKIFFPEKNPKRSDRFATVNAGFKNMKNEIHIHVNPKKAKRLVADFEIMGYKEGTSEPEEYPGTDIGHMVDGFGYMVYKLMPMKLETVHTTRIVMA